MTGEISFEINFFFISILWGALLLVAYDVLRIFRRLIKHDSFAIALEDLIFWVCASLYIFIMIYKENNGVIRGFSIMGMTIGIVFYHYIASEFLVHTITSLIKVVLGPIIYLINKIKKLVKLIYGKAKIASTFLIIQLKKRKKSVRITLSKRKEVILVKKRLKAQEKKRKKEEKAKKKADQTSRKPSKKSRKKDQGHSKSKTLVRSRQGAGKIRVKEPRGKKK